MADLTITPARLRSAALHRGEELATFLQRRPPEDGKRYDCQCGRCGSSMSWVECIHCVDGFNGHDCGEDTCCCAVVENNILCDVCGGREGWWSCLSGDDWCADNPLDGRASVNSATPEWFEVQS